MSKNLSDSPGVQGEALSWLINAKGVMQYLSCSKTTAYKVIHELKKELEENEGFPTVGIRSGELPKQYFYDRYQIPMEIRM